MAQIQDCPVLHAFRYREDAWSKVFVYGQSESVCHRHSLGQEVGQQEFQGNVHIDDSQQDV